MVPQTAVPAGRQNSGHTSGFRLPSWKAWMLLAAACYSAFLNFPVSIGLSGTGLDASWRLGLNLAHSQGLVAGRDIIFTYGPLGYLVYPESASGAPFWALAF